MLRAPRESSAQSSSVHSFTFQLTRSFFHPSSSPLFHHSTLLLFFHIYFFTSSFFHSSTYSLFHSSIFAPLHSSTVFTCSHTFFQRFLFTPTSSYTRQLFFNNKTFSNFPSGSKVEKLNEKMMVSWVMVEKGEEVVLKDSKQHSLWDALPRTPTNHADHTCSSFHSIETHF